MRARCRTGVVRLRKQQGRWSMRLRMQHAPEHSAEVMPGFAAMHRPSHKMTSQARTAQDSHDPQLQHLLVGQRLEPPHLAHTRASSSATFMCLLLQSCTPALHLLNHNTARYATVTH